jgi:hypothetical protein
LNLLMFHSFRLVAETTQTKVRMGRFFTHSSFSNPVHRTGVSLLTTKLRHHGADWSTIIFPDKLSVTFYHCELHPAKVSPNQLTMAGNTQT